MNIHDLVGQGWASLNQKWNSDVCSKRLRSDPSKPSVVAV